MPRIASRIAAITPSATLVVDSKAKALKADGQPVIGFGAGEPDFPTPAHIVEAARQALNDPKNFRYSPSAGLPELKQAIAERRPSVIPVCRLSPHRCSSPTGVSRRSTRRLRLLLIRATTFFYPPPTGPPTLSASA